MEPSTITPKAAVAEALTVLETLNKLAEGVSTNAATAPVYILNGQQVAAGTPGSVAYAAAPSNVQAVGTTQPVSDEANCLLDEVFPAKYHATASTFVRDHQTSQLQTFPAALAGEFAFWSAVGIAKLKAIAANLADGAADEAPQRANWQR